MAVWISEVQVLKAEAHSVPAGVQNRQRLSVVEIRELVASVGGLAGANSEATAEDKRELHRALGLRLTYEPAHATVRAEVNLDPHAVELKRVSGGGLEPPRPVKGTSTSS